MGQHRIVAMAHARIENCTIFNDNLITLFVMEMRMPITRNDVVLPEMVEPNFRPFCHRKNVIAQKLLTTENRFEFEKIRKITRIGSYSRFYSVEIGSFVR